MTNLDTQIESILFYKAEPIKVTALAKMLDKSPEEIQEGVNLLKEKLQDRGLSLVEKEDSIALVTSTENSELIQNLKKEELTKDLSKAAVETLSIVIYRGPIKRAEIDYIRGVNSQFILRLLLVRGLIEKITNPEDERGYLYKASFDLLNHLGIGKIEDMPEYESVNTDIDNFISDKEEDEQV